MVVVDSVGAPANNVTPPNMAEVGVVDVTFAVEMAMDWHGLIGVEIQLIKGQIN